jgi:hypothetical protein
MLQFLDAFSQLCRFLLPFFLGGTAVARRRAHGGSATWLLFVIRDLDNLHRLRDVPSLRIQSEGSLVLSRWARRLRVGIGSDSGCHDRGYWAGGLEYSVVVLFETFITKKELCFLVLDVPCGVNQGRAEIKGRRVRRRNQVTVTYDVLRATESGSLQNLIVRYELQILYLFKSHV